jgi:hypothetical protein
MKLFILAVVCAASLCAQLPLPGSGTAPGGGGGTGDATLGTAQTFTAPKAFSAGIDASTSTGATKPIRSGTTLPGTCTVSELFYDSDAPAGQNLYACTATNTWTLLTGGSSELAVGTGAGSATAFTSTIAAVTVLNSGKTIQINAPATNTSGAFTLNVSSTGAKPVKTALGLDPAPGSVRDGAPYQFRYDVTADVYYLLNPSALQAGQITSSDALVDVDCSTGTCDVTNLNAVTRTGPNDLDGSYDFTDAEVTGLPTGARTYVGTAADVATVAASPQNNDIYIVADAPGTHLVRSGGAWVPYVYGQQFQLPSTYTASYTTFTTSSECSISTASILHIATCSSDTTTPAFFSIAMPGAGTKTFAFSTTAANNRHEVLMALRGTDGYTYGSGIVRNTSQDANPFLGRRLIGASDGIGGSRADESSPPMVFSAFAGQTFCIRSVLTGNSATDTHTISYSPNCSTYYQVSSANYNGIITATPPTFGFALITTAGGSLRFVGYKPN